MLKPSQYEFIEVVDRLMLLIKTIMLMDGYYYCQQRVFGVKREAYSNVL
jgi:hypothetical protein